MAASAQDVKKSTDKGKKGTPKQAAGKETPSKMDTTGEFPAFDPTAPNKNKVTPDCASIEMSGVVTMSELLKYFVLA